MNYSLKPNCNMVAFLRCVDSCRGEVTFESRQGDILNLKSQLSKYLFLTVAPDQSYLSGSHIACSPEDSARLLEFLAVPEL